jgi:hypothetical protein
MQKTINKFRIIAFIILSNLFIVPNTTIASEESELPSFQALEIVLEGIKKDHATDQILNRLNESENQDFRALIETLKKTYREPDGPNRIMGYLHNKTKVLDELGEAQGNIFLSLVKNLNRFTSTGIYNKFLYG